MQWFYWIITLVISAGAGYWVYRADKKREVPLPWLTALLRGLVIFLTLLLIAAPVITITRNETQKPVILFLQDNSGSIAHALGNDSVNYKKNAEALLDKLSPDYKVVRWGFGNTIQNDSIFSYRQPATNISAALSRVQEFYGMQNLGGVILASDGRFNEGSNPVYQQLSLNGSLYTVGIGDSAMQKDLRISGVFANRTVSLNSQFEIRADITAALCKGYSNAAVLSEQGNTLSTTVSVNTDRYDRSISFTVTASRPGVHHYIITLPPADGEQNTANNRKDVFVEVINEKKKILLAAAAPHPDINAIKEALNGMERYDLTVALQDKLPTVRNFDAVILHQVPAINDNVSDELRLIKKPTWYILGSKTNPGLLNQLPKPVAININPIHLSDILPSYNAAFNVFTLPQNIRAVTDKLPPLGVPAGSITASANASVLFSARGNEQMPLWVLQQGSTPLALLAGEGIWRWRIYEYRFFNEHNAVDECIRQTVSFLTAGNEKPFRVEFPKYVWSDQEPVILNAYLLNSNNEQVNTADVTFSITDSAGNKQDFSFERSGNAYRLNIGIWAGGNYTYTAATNYNGKTYTETGSFAVESMPLELLETGADYALLYSLARKQGGSFLPAANIGSLYDSITANKNIKPVIQTHIETVPLVDWKWYFFLVLIIAIAEWLLRKYWLAQ